MDFANSGNYWFNYLVRDAKIISFSTIEKPVINLIIGFFMF